MNLLYEDKESSEKEQLVQELSYYLYQEKTNASKMEIVFLCIGTDHILGDCLGPLVGTGLKEKLEPHNISNITIYGTLKENLCYTNIKDTLKIIEKKHQNPCLIVVDAALSQEENIGKIFVKKEKIELGKGLYKSKIEVGNISIKAVVGKNYKRTKYNFASLQNVPLNEVMTLSQIIVEGICEVIKYI